MQKLKYLGVPVYMNGQNYYLPSLSYRDFKANYAFLVADPPTPDDAEKMASFFEERVPIVGQAIRRNYPEVTDEMLLEWLDMTTLPIALRACAAASGLVPVSEGE